MTYSYVNIDLDDIDTDDLVETLENRGYNVSKKKLFDLTDVVWRFKSGYIQESMIALERVCPELYGISKLVGEK